MWLKLMLSAVIIAFCTFMGYLAASKYRSRRKFFTQMTTFNERYLNELTFSRRAIKDLIGETRENGDFYELLEKKDVQSLPQYLSEQEKKECVDYLKMLGAGDSASQKGYFSAKKKSLESKKAESEKAAKDRGELYVKLGLLAGLAFVILIL